MRAWDLRCPNLVTKHQTEIRKILTTKPEFSKSAQLEVTNSASSMTAWWVFMLEEVTISVTLEVYTSTVALYRKWMIQTKDLMEERTEENRILSARTTMPPLRFCRFTLHFMQKSARRISMPFPCAITT